MKTAMEITSSQQVSSLCSEGLNTRKAGYVGFLGGSVVKFLLANAGAAGDRVPSLGGEDLLEEEMAIHSSIVA